MSEEQLSSIISSEITDSINHFDSEYSADRLRAMECPSDIVDAIDGWKTSGVGHGYGNGYPLEVLQKWMMKI